MVSPDDRASSQHVVCATHSTTQLARCATQLDRLMADAHKRYFDVVVAWKFDRFARSVGHLLRALEAFQALGVQFVSLTEGVDTSTPAGKMVFTVLGAVAELERNLIVERVKAGMRHAKAKGRLPGRKRMPLDLAAIEQRQAAGESLRAVARSLGVSPALLVKRFKAQRKHAGQA